MTDMVEVVIDSIRVSLMSQQRIVILRETTDERYLPIWIGIYEAEAITLSLQEVEVARPLTWDLLKNVFGILDARVQRVEVVALKEDTFYGNIVIEVNGKELNIDSRPSDALALAVRSHVPIFVNRTIMDMAGITPEEDLQEKTEDRLQDVARSTPKTESTPDSEEGLEVFEDFFEKLDLDDMEDNGDDEAKTP
jgi:bifunctional DNase/RNase